MTDSVFTLDKLREAMRMIDDVPPLHRALGLPWGESFSGMRIVANPLLTYTAEDWSECRSPSRAKRRRRMGHRQHNRFLTRPQPRAYTIDGGRTYFMHPEIIRELKLAIDGQVK